MDFLTRHQSVGGIATIVLAVIAGSLVEPLHRSEVLIEPLLAALLYATFLSVSMSELPKAARDRSLTLALLAINFVVVPLVVWLITRPIADDDVLLLGVLLVLFTPCIDYVIVFTAMSGGAAERLIAQTPLLLVAQLAALPAFLWMFVGSDALSMIDFEPFVRAFVVLIVVPLGAAWLTQAIPGSGRWQSGWDRLMVPLLFAVLFVVVASQVPLAWPHREDLSVAIVVHLSFAIVMVALGTFIVRHTSLDVPSRRAVVLSGVTRNSLVVLPLALALPSVYALVPLVIVSQTLVELIVLSLCTHLIPRLLPTPPAPESL